MALSGIVIARQEKWGENVATLGKLKTILKV